MCKNTHRMKENGKLEHINREAKILTIRMEKTVFHLECH